MLKPIILSLLLLQAFNSQCGKGCLRCADKSSTDSTKVCYLCDVNSRYYMKTDQTCVLSDLSNCEVLNHDNQCLLCSTNYFSDFNTHKCVAVDTLKKVTNCEYYDSNQNCMDCQKDYLLTNNSQTPCTVITTPISNCMIYSTQDTCSKCNFNYYLAEDKKSCKALPSDCLGYSLTQCKSCKSGSIINHNRYKKDLYKWTTNVQRDGLYMLIWAQRNNYRFDHPLHFCETTVAKYCATFKTFDQCDSCIAGYYLDQNTKICTVFPEPIIPNCQIYVYDEVIRWKYKCVDCKQGYFLKDKKNCIAVDKTDVNCEIYETAANTTSCSRCKNDKILTNNSCATDRTLIANCSVHYASLNKCIKCNDGYTKNQDETACKKVTPNCLTPKAFTSASEENILCDKCQDEYYLTADNTCSKGTKNCREYTSETTCTNCLNQFYPTNTCENKHPNIGLCQVYSQTTTNRCLLCEAMKIPIYLTQKCKVYNAISNCLTHNHNSQDVNNITCTQCDDGYVLANSNTRCDLIPANENCNAKNLDGTCTQCKMGYYLVRNSSTNVFSCISIPNYITQNCSQYIQQLNASNTWNLDDQCDACQGGFIGVNENTCVLRTNLVYLGLQTIPENCLHSDNTNCLRCKDGFYLDGGACANTCAKSIFWVDDMSINACKTSETGLVNANTNEDQDIQIAVNCKTNQLTTLNQALKSTNINYWKTQNTTAEPSVYNIADQQQGVTCNAALTEEYKINNETQAANTIANQTIGKDRKVYIYSSTNTPKHFLTVTCGWQKKGTLTNNAENFTYVACEETVNAQSEFSSQRLGGVPSVWSNLFSVHKCNNSQQAQNKIPVLVGLISNLEKFTGYQRYTFARDDLVPQEGDTVGNNIICLDVATPTTIKSGLSVSSDVANIADFKDCGLGFIDLTKYVDRTDFDSTGYNINQANAATRTGKEQLQCLACKPGYKSDPAYVSNSTFARKCTAITQCNLTAQQTIFNGCSQCNTGYTWSSNDQGVIDFSVCVKIPQNLNNCIAYENTGGDNGDSGSCKYCDKGYYLTIDGYCEQIQIPSCTGNFYQKVTGNSVVKNYLHQHGYGCSNCGDNMLLYEASNQCVKLPSLFSNTLRDYSNTKVITTSQSRGNGHLINKCEKYTIGNVCHECVNGYIITADGRKCVQKPTSGGLAKCVLLDNAGTICQECENIDGYGLVNGQGCVLQKIDGCSVYNYYTTRASVECVTCQDTYYRHSSTQCKKGKVPYCLHYNDAENQCTNCQQGYWLLNSTTSEVASYCIPKDTSIGCSDASFTIQSDSSPGNGNYNYLSVTCNSCESSYGYIVNTEDTDVKSKCHQISYPGTCQTLDNLFYVADNGYPFQCTKCADTEYLLTDLKNYSCQTRTNDDEERVNCQRFSLNSEKCVECKTGTYLNKNETGCTPYPTGDYACVEYDNFLKCTECDEDHYFVNNVCVKVATPEPVTNCYLYLNATTCEVCDSGYFLNNNVCELKSTSINCATFEAKDSCKTCPAEYKLTTSNGKNSCVKVIKPSNCYIVDVDTAKCIECDQDYYVNVSGQCTKKEIANCAVNKSETQCQRCLSGFALSTDQTKCLSNTDLAINCYEGVVASTPICSICKAGYSFNNGSCQKNANATIENGCFDEDANKKCQFCISGWSMGTDGKCTNNNPPSQPESVGIRLVGLLLAMLFFQFI